MKKHNVILVILLIMASMLIIPTPTKALRYSKNTFLWNVDASFIGEEVWDVSGTRIASAGDVNADGYDDILIGAGGNDEGGDAAGQSYIILGKATGWAMDTNLSKADASFIGEGAGNYSGGAVAGAGDVNGDGYDDILIGAHLDDSGGDKAGQTYLILGGATGWTMDTNLSKADASFIGEDDDDRAGYWVAGAGDVNGDGYCDILIGAYRDEDGGWCAGQTYLIFGKATGWVMDNNLSKADASFIGEDAGDYSGCSAGAGDVNGDGYDDILIGAYQNEDGGNDAGQTYLILGKATGWAMDTKLANADASFIGEEANDWSGWPVAGAGDVNGDGYDDILIGARYSNEGEIGAGQTYLIFGKASGWAMDTDLSNADASFRGEHIEDYSGCSVAGAGDINGDGYDDILIGAYQENRGWTYLILGKASGWAMDVNLGNADASFIGEFTNDYSGWSVAGACDANGDGYDDIMIGARYNDEGGNNAGQTYLIFPDANSKPSVISSVKTYSDDKFSIEISKAKVNDTIYVELRGTDGNASRADTAIVNVKSSDSAPKGFNLRLYETGLNTGIYQGNFTIKDRTHDNYHWIKSLDAEIITVFSTQNPSKSATILVGNLVLYPKTDDLTAQEDEQYNVHYSTVNLPNINWLFETNASWLEWNVTSHNLTGTPDNSDVGSYFVRINISRAPIFYDEHNFTLAVINTPPNITTGNIEHAIQDQKYFMDYNCSDDGQGVITWHLTTNGSWLQINATTGNLTGTPEDADVGSCWVKVSVDDGNGGWDAENFTLYITNINDPPEILTNDILTALEDEEYRVTYEAVDVDIDLGDKITWQMDSNASFLAMYSATSILHGMPTNDDVGDYWVNVTVSDLALASDSHNFTLTVINVNDPPVITSKPIIEAIALSLYKYQLNVTEVDKGDILTYYLDTGPDNMAINETHGLITWTPNIDQEGDNPVTVRVSDGNVSDTQEFNIKVTLPPLPRVTLIFPPDNSIIDSISPTLTWSCEDPDSDVIYYDVYLHSNLSKVQTMALTSRLANNQTNDSYVAPDLIPGSGYYWTVIPNDGEYTGYCLSGIWGFEVSDTTAFNVAPTITSEPIINATVGVQYRYEVKGEDENKEDVLTYSLIANPNNMHIDADSGVILWTPMQEQLGKHTVTVIVSDGKLSGEQTFEITVTLRNIKPEVSAIPEKAIRVGDKFSYQVVANDANAEDVLTYRLENMPAGMTINQTGMISWIPEKNQVGRHTITLNITDGKDYTLTDFTINVKKEDTTTGGLDSTIMGIIIIVIILVIVLLVVAMIMKKRKGKEEFKDKYGIGIEGEAGGEISGELVETQPQPQQPHKIPEQPQYGADQMVLQQQLEAQPYSSKAIQPTEIGESDLSQQPQSTTTVIPKPTIQTPTLVKPQPVTETGLPPSPVEQPQLPPSEAEKDESGENTDISKSEPDMVEPSIEPTVGPDSESHPIPPTESESSIPVQDESTIPEKSCPNCGAPVKAGWYVCSKCQFKLT